MGCPFLLQGLSATSSLLTLQGLCLGCFFFQHSFLPTTPSLLSSLYPRLSFRGHLSEHIMKGCFPPHPHTPNCFHHLHCFYKEADVCNYDSGELKMGEGHQEYINHFCHHIFLFSSVITTDSIYQLKASLLFIKLFLGYFQTFRVALQSQFLPTSPDTLGTMERLIVLGRHVWSTISPSHRFLLFMVFGHLPPSLLQ